METSNNHSSSEPLALDGLSNLWAKTLGDPEITIAILDGPCDTNHPSLTKASITQMNFLGSGAIDGPASEHGTHTASIIFGQHDGQVRGIAPQCKGLIIPIFRNNPQGGISACSQPDLARAIRAAANSGANIINVSGGEFSFTGTAHPMLKDAVQECQRQGRLIVAAAGNDGCSCLHVPGALPSVLAVGAMDADGNPTDFSNWGSQYQASGILAPGVNILGAFPGQKVGVRTGTSFATPIASGVAALLLSVQKRQGQEPDTQAVRTVILASALGCEYSEVPDCRRLLGGRINVSGAVSKIISLSKIYKGGETMADSSSVLDQAMVDQQVSSVAPSAQADTAASQETVSPVGQNVQANSPGDSAPIRTNVTSEANVVAAGMGATTRRVVSPSAVMASECGCQPHGEHVYAIGGISVDFGTQARFDSIQQSAEGYDTGQKLNLHDKGDFLRHLLGWREVYEFEAEKGKKETKERFHSAHLYDAKQVIWYLTHDETPLYALQPAGSFSEEGYFELAHFLLEAEGFEDTHENVPQDRGPLNEFYHPSLDTSTKAGHNHNRSPRPLIERIAIAGSVTGTVRLMNGMEIPVVSPNQRGTRAWSLKALLKLYADIDPTDKSEKGEADRKKRLFMERLVLRLMEEARNPGRTGVERATNFCATHSFKIANNIQTFLRVNHEPDLDTVEVEPSPTCRNDSECYDVLFKFFDAENLNRAGDVLRYTIDVSDEVPVLLGEPRHYRAR